MSEPQSQDASLERILLVGDEFFNGEFINNYGAPTRKDKPFSSVLHHEIEKCTEFTDEYLKDIKGGTAVFYTSSEQYDAWKGHELVPERIYEYKQFNGNGDVIYKNYDFDNARYYSDELKVRTCHVKSEKEGFTWTVQRLGPFSSIGNYDWWTFGWTNFGHFKEVLAEHPNGIIVDSQHICPIKDGTWELLGLPPIHQHHVHISRDPLGDKVHQKTTVDKYSLELIGEQHGDYQCLEENGGLDCLMKTWPEGSGKWFDVPLTIDGELNDVRPPRSEKLTWWLETAFRWTTDLSKVNEEISLIVIANPGTFNIAKQSNIFTYPTPTDKETMMWYTGKMPSDGKLFTNGVHSHAAVFHSMYFFKATPAELGLDHPKFMPVKTYVPLGVKELGYSSISSLATWIFNHLNEKSNLAQADSPRAICRSRSSFQEIDGFIYDRMPEVQCEEWEFKEGDDFVSVMFTKSKGFPKGPSDPNYFPPFVVNHAVWAFFFVDYKSPHSHVQFNQYTQTGFAFGNKAPPTLVDVLCLIVNGGMVQHTSMVLINTITLPALLLLSVFIIYLLWKCKSLAKKNLCYKNVNKKDTSDKKYIALALEEAEASDDLLDENHNEEM